MHESRTTSTRSTAGPARAGTGSSRTRGEARAVINAGKMAVVMGIETSVPFGCTFKSCRRRRPGRATPSDRSTGSSTRCTRLGVRQMELVNKFDNALSGVAGDDGADRRRRQQRQLPRDRRLLGHASTASRPTPRRTTRTSTPLPDDRRRPAGRALRRDRPALRRCCAPALPVYPPARPLQPARPDRRSASTSIDAAGRARDALRPRPHERQGARRRARPGRGRCDYPGVMSSHSWSTPDAYPRIYELGGFIAPYAGDSTGFVEKWRRHLEWADPRYYFGLGYGADMNGLGAQGDPRGADVPNPVTYPFRGLGGVTVEQAARRRAGLRHQRRRRRAVRPLPRLDRGPAAWSPTPSAATATRSRRHGARRRGLPADVGAGRRASPPTRAATPAARARGDVRATGSGPGSRRRG